MAVPTYAPCSNGATPLRARGGNLVGAGKRFPEADVAVEADDAGRTLAADDRGRTLTAAEGGRTVGDE